MPYVIRRENKKSRERGYLAGKSINWPDDHVAHGGLVTDDIERAYAFSSYPDAMAAAGVFGNQLDADDFDYEVIEVKDCAKEAESRHPAAPNH